MTQTGLFKRTFVALSPLGALLLAPMPATAADFSFTGNFTRDDDVQLFDFTVGATSTVVLRTWSYAGGTNAAGQAIARGGFDPILALFDSTGAYVDQNDDGGCGDVAQDISGACYDTYFSASLTPGTYTASVMEYDNFANQPNLSDGFERDGQGNFTTEFNCNQSQFNDVSDSQYCGRDSHWAFDILNVDEASAPPPITDGVPEPASWALMIAGFAAAGGMLRGRRRAAIAFS